MPLYLHNDLRVLRVSNNAASFLKAYTTHLADSPKTAFLNREGRMIAFARQAKVSENEILLVVGAAYVDRLLTHLSKYLSLCETKITSEKDWFVYFDADGSSVIGKGDVVIPEKSGRWVLSCDKAKPASMTAEEYTRFRVEHEIPEQGIDFEDEMPLCIDESWVNFEKGCYLGQEIVARVHYRGKPPKKLLIKKQSECFDKEVDRITSRVTLGGQIKGFLFVTT